MEAITPNNVDVRLKAVRSRVGQHYPEENEIAMIQAAAPELVEVIFTGLMNTRSWIDKVTSEEFQSLGIIGSAVLGIKRLNPDMEGLIVFNLVNSISRAINTLTCEDWTKD